MPSNIMGAQVVFPEEDFSILSSALKQPIKTYDKGHKDSDVTYWTQKESTK